MKKITIYLIAAMLFMPLLPQAKLPYSPPRKWSEGIAQTVMTRFPSASMIPFRVWCYPQGYFLMGLDKLWRTTGNKEYYDYIMEYANRMVDADGKPTLFKGNSMDDMMAGSVFVWAYHHTREERFLKAAQAVRKSFDDYPRTGDGIFWHGRGTTGQIWVDGVFMGQMFLTKYGAYIGDTRYCFDEAAKQIIGMYRHLLKGDSGLLYHGWDESRKARWANPQTGMSTDVWSEGLGWYALIMVETLEIMPKTHNEYNTLVEITRQLCEGLYATQDKASGLWYQIVDKGDDPQNWHETSGSAMFTYAIKRALELGFISGKKYDECVHRAYKGLLTKAQIAREDGLIDLYDANNGLSIQKDYQTYITRPKKINGQEVISSFLWATWIVEKGNKRVPTWFQMIKK